MKNKPQKDIIIDTNTIRLYDNPADPLIKALFLWLKDHGTLTVSKKLIVEYVGIGNKDLAGLLNHLIVQNRYRLVSTIDLKKFSEDKRYKYTCNLKDKWHAKLVFLSIRKLLVTGDNPLCNDVNNFKTINKIQPRATKRPNPSFYT